MILKDKRLQIFFYIAWFILLLLQAIYTDLGNDETYYWKYSTNLDWGYFDHPPVIALLIKIGCLFFKNELGVRLVSILMSLASIFLIEIIIVPSNKKLFYAVISSIVVFQIGGIMAVPDIPVVFFSILFFFLYKKYLDYDKWYLSLSISFIISIMLLTKYHGILIVLFTLIGNIKIVKRFSLWIIAVCFAFLMIPHLIWQINNNFITIQYQLFERSDNAYSIMSTLEYMLSQPFVFGPLIGILLMYYGYKNIPENLFEKVVRVNLFGVYIFFFLMTLKGRVEANWITIACFPLIYTGYQEIEKRINIHRTVYILFMVSLPLILILRIYLIYDFLPVKWDGLSEFHDSREWANSIRKVAKDKTVVFNQSYKQAARYEFYTGCAAISYNTIGKRKDQYNVWDSESKLQGKSVMFVTNWPIGDSILTLKNKVYYMFIDNFRSYSNVKISCKTKMYYRNNISPFYISVRLDYLNKNIRDFSANKDYPSYVVYRLYKNKEFILEKRTDLLVNNDMINNNQYYKFLIESPNRGKGEYNLFISIQTGWLIPTVNGDKIKIIMI